ncbi:aspartyl-tRNA amidotransferase [bacterium (Candidatus Torokbacteria) CG_4_10_14_0_2_um_filter_35_8]|nr:MAG: aspartyl-tRNA amidotransferase [bacterium (Candidatus Torokbacteria) CG_4_10_14_0_2_um_filter_35_8]
MKLIEKINSDFKNALKNQDQSALSALRMLKSTIRNKEIELKEMPLDEKEVLRVISSEVKKRKMSLEEFRKGAREDLAEKEQEEIKILEEYLPEKISASELEKIIKKAINVKGATSEKDLGLVISYVMPIVQGRVEGNVMREKVLKMLQDL